VFVGGRESSRRRKKNVGVFLKAPSHDRKYVKTRSRVGFVSFACFPRCERRTIKHSLATTDSGVEKIIVRHTGETIVLVVRIRKYAHVNRTRPAGLDQFDKTRKRERRT